MSSIKVSCKNCKEELQVTPWAPRVRCHICQAVYQLGRHEEPSSGYDHRGCRLGSFGMHIKKKMTSSGRHSSPNPPASLPPMYNNKPIVLRPIDQPYKRRRAVLCGVSYNNWKFRLKGTINDVISMKSLLLDHFKFPRDSVLVLTEEEENPRQIPTKENMQRALKWLVEGCQSGDSLVFYFSGHGLRQPDFNQDEIDGFDESLCPVDFKTAGMILDNDLNTTIVRPLKPGVTLHAIIDACHSGTVLDLEHVYNRKLNKWEDNRPPSGADKSTSGGLAICFSACADDQMAADTTAFSGKEMAGAMTYIFVQTIKKMQILTYGYLLDEIHAQIEAARKTKWSFVPIIQRLIRNRFLQDCQLSSSREFDVDSTELRL